MRTLLRGWRQDFVAADEYMHAFACEVICQCLISIIPPNLVVAFFTWRSTMVRVDYTAAILPGETICTLGSEIFKELLLPTCRGSGGRGKRKVQETGGG